MFRFSLKWILVAMVYAAIAAAAFSQETWVYADILCAVSLLALGYAVMLIIYARGERQAAAAGFAVFVVLLAACLLMAPQSVPSMRILQAAGVGQNPITFPLPSTPAPAPATWSAPAMTSGGTPIPVAGSSIQPYAPATSAWSLVAAPAYPTIYYPDITPKLRAFNAVATMIIGLLGCLLGVAAYRRAKTPAAA